jgi:hypothetical protein
MWTAISYSNSNSMLDLQSVVNSDTEEEFDLGESDAESLPDFFSAYNSYSYDEKIGCTESQMG